MTREHQIDAVLKDIRAAICQLDGRCMDRDSGEPCEEEPNRDLWCTSCSRAGEALP